MNYLDTIVSNICKQFHFKNKAKSKATEFVKGLVNLQKLFWNSTWQKWQWWENKNAENRIENSNRVKSYASLKIMQISI